ncbi:MAG: CPBP family intramembrane metalloprotease [Gammaproteobacteria bacterium]|nr:CPBP family intramembrane metalloprotease [Gammaproteobacteria bacterium]MDH5653943.1 CPBP family intramembrane metalloprotease [Gammaproteobacteria bacterium]
MIDTIKHYKHPMLFYFLATAIPWVCWFTAGYISHLTPQQPHHAGVVGLLGFAGLLSPVIIAWWLMAKNSMLKDDLANRLFSLKKAGPVYIVLTLLLMPASILLAQAVSLLFGYSADQFMITGHFTFSSGVFPVWVLLIVAPLLEELAWHSYGTDCLRNRFNLFNTSMIFGLFWGLWHIPLSSINDYYHSNIVATGWMHGVNFLVSLFPFVIIMNWLYYKTGRNILVAIVFHITAGYFNEIFATHPDSKVIQTGLLIVFSIVLVVKDKEFFFTKQYSEAG